MTDVAQVPNSISVAAIASSYLVSYINNAITHSDHPAFAWINKGDSGKRRAVALFLSAATAVIITLLTESRLDEGQTTSLISSGLVLFGEVLSGQAFFHHWFLKGGQQE